MIVIVILTIARNLEQAKQVQRHLKEHKFPKSIIRISECAPKGSSNKTISESIFTSHYETLQWFLQQYPSTKSDQHTLIVMEDDCEFIVKKPVWPRVHETLKYLNKNHPQWATLSIGHCPIGPIFPTEHSELVYSSLPYGAHCYALHGLEFQTLICKHKRWTRPFAFEGWLNLALRQKFAFYPTIATQNRLPRDMKFFEPLNLNFCEVVHITESVMMYSLQGICIIVLFVMLVSLLRKR